MLTLAELVELLPESPVTPRLLAHVEEVPGPPGMGPCLMWTGHLREGYGRIRDDSNRMVSVHIWVYVQLHGPVPKGLELHHECHEAAVNLGTCDGGKACPHRACVIHTKPTTRRDNLMRGKTLAARQAAQTRCNGKYAPPGGHDLTDPRNVYRRPSNPNIRDCVPCMAKALAEYKRRHGQLVARTPGAGTQLTLLDL